MEYNEIVSLMEEMTKMGLTKIKLERDDFKLELEKRIDIQSSVAATNGLGEENAKINRAVANEAVADVVMTNGAVVNEAAVDGIIGNEVTGKASADKELVATKKILSPMVGTFYAQPAPDKPPFVTIGDLVKVGQSVCIIEAMKLMNEIESEVEGEIVECLVENEDMVEFGQPLFLLK